jgi:hypothetical protein
MFSCSLLLAQAQLSGPPAPQPAPAATLTPLPVAADATETSGVGHWIDRLGGEITLIIIAVALILIIGIVLFMRRGNNQWDDSYAEPEPPHSRYEQLLAEIQGLTLRLAGGESPGYYRKIETLARIFLERNGFPGARQMSDVEIRAILSGGQLPPQQAQAIGSIYDRARLGAEHESEKHDFTALDLLKDLNTLIRQVEGIPARHI